MRRISRKKRRRRMRKITAMVLFLFMALMVTFTAKSVLGAFLLTEGQGVDSEKEPLKTQSGNGGISEHMISVKGLSQAGIPTGCEAVTAVAALQYRNVMITPEEFINIFLPKENFYIKNGITYGANPHEAFPGNPFEAGLGCFSEVIAAALTDMKECGFSGMDNLVIANVSGVPFTELEGYVAEDIPVICWVTIGMQESVSGMEYYFADGTFYRWRAKEHCMLLMGYDENSYYFCDPLSGGAVVSYEKTLVSKRYEEMGKQAVVVY